MWIGEKFQSNPEIAGSPRNSFRASLGLSLIHIFRKGIKLTYTTDTRPVRTIAEHAKDSDLFICEGMYGEQDLSLIHILNIRKTYETRIVEKETVGFRLLGDS